MANEPAPAQDHTLAPQPPDSTELLKPRGGKAKVLVALAVLAVAGIGALFYFDHRAKEASRKAVAQRFADLQHCLLGDDLGKDTPSQRIRAIQLAQMGLSLDARGGGNAWPTRCWNAANELRTALQNEPGAPKDESEIAKGAREVAETLRSSEDPVDSPELAKRADALWALADQRKIDRVSSTLGDAAPAPATAPAIKDWKAPVFAQPGFGLGSLFVEASPNGAPHVIVDDATGAAKKQICTLTLGAAPKCAPLPAGIPEGQPPYRLLGSADAGAAPLVFTGRRGEQGVYRSSDGTRVASVYAYGGSVKSDGSAAVLGWIDGGEKPILFRDVAGNSTKTDLDSPGNVSNYFYDSAVAWDWIVWRTMPEKAEAPHAFAQAWAPTGALAAPIDVGEITWGASHEVDTPAIRSCRAGDMIAVWIDGSEHDDILLYSGGKWLAPLNVNTYNGDLTCAPGEASMTSSYASSNDSEGSFDLSQSRCTTNGCAFAHAAFKVPAATAPKSGADIVDLGGAHALILWQAGARGGLRMRAGAITDLAKANDVVLVDDVVDGQSAILDARAFAVPGGAVVFVATKDAVRTFGVDTNGTIVGM